MSNFIILLFIFKQAELWFTKNEWDCRNKNLKKKKKKKRDLLKKNLIDVFNEKQVKKNDKNLNIYEVQ
jgi:hypothetical protein